MLNKDQLRDELNRPTAYSHFNEKVYGSMTDFDRTKRFHQKMGLQCNDSPIMPSVSDRILRAKLLLEETVETIEKGLGVRIIIGMENLQFFSGDGVGGALDIQHVEGDFYDPIETLDGLADVKVITEGTAVAFGLPLEEASYEVYCSNMTKLDGNGNPIVNRCKYPGSRDILTALELDAIHDAGHIQACILKDRGLPCTEESHLIDPTKPAGKLLKSEFYVPANIARVLVDSQVDTGPEMVNVTRWLINQAPSE
jgi:predicted HAD superfamily Cof-like phosphohydrolase